jgi:peptide subunit release factor 1 (eRF1)
MATVTEQLDRLAQLDPAPYPVVSLYLNTQPGQNGRDQHQAFVRSEFKSRSRTYPEGSPERDSLDKDLERITTYLENDLAPSANGVAIFACSAGELFEAVQLSAPIDQHSLYIGDTPHLYPLARVESRYPRYAVVVADTNTARIFVFAAAELVSQRAVTGQKTRRSSQGGWSQARFQRHIENYHQQHIKEVVAALERIVEQERIEHVILAGDEVVLPLFRDELPKPLAEKVVDRVKLDAHASVGEILDTTIEAMRLQNSQSELEKVTTAIDNYRSGALGVVGPEKTLDALVRGQVDELLITSNLQALDVPIPGASVAASLDSSIMQPAVEVTTGGEAAQADPRVLRWSEELVRRAKQTAARVTVIEDASLLEEFGGVAAILRFRL